MSEGWHIKNMNEDWRKNLFNKVNIEDAIINDLYNRIGVYDVTHDCWVKSQDITVEEIQKLFPEHTDKIKNVPYIEIEPDFFDNIKHYDLKEDCNDFNCKLVSITGKRFYQFYPIDRTYIDYYCNWYQLDSKYNFNYLFKEYLKIYVKQELSNKLSAITTNKDYSYVNDWGFSNYVILKKPIVDFDQYCVLFGLSSLNMFHFSVCSEKGCVLINKPEGGQFNIDIDKFKPVDLIEKYYTEDCIKAELTACEMYDNKIFPLGVVPNLCQGSYCQFDINNCDYVCIGYPHPYNEEYSHKNYATHSVIVPKETFLSVKEQMVKAYAHTAACPCPMQKEEYYASFELNGTSDSEIASMMLNYSKDVKDSCIFRYADETISFLWKDYLFYDDFMCKKHGKTQQKEPNFKNAEKTDNKKKNYKKPKI